MTWPGSPSTHKEAPVSLPLWAVFFSWHYTGFLSIFKNIFVYPYVYVYVYICLAVPGPTVALRILYLRCDVWNLFVVACRVLSYCSWGSQGKNAEVVCHSLLQGTTFCQNSPPGEGDERGQDGWMTSLTQWTWVWASSRSWWWTGKPGMLQSMGSQRVGHDWATEQQQMQNLQLEHANSQFTWDPVPWLNPSPCTGSAGLSPLDHQGSPHTFFLIVSFP